MSTNISYTSDSGVKLARQSENSMLTVNPLDLAAASQTITLDTFANGRLMRATINKYNGDGSNTDEYADFLATQLPFINMPLSWSQQWKKTHDLSTVADWDSRTNADIVWPLFGGATKHPISRLWLN